MYLIRILIISVFLLIGADITQKTSSNDTPIYLASYRATKNPETWDQKILELLYRAGKTILYIYINN